MTEKLVVNFKKLVVNDEKLVTKWTLQQMEFYWGFVAYTVTLYCIMSILVVA